ncbi:succinate dehydrogenase cytochrome b subunit [Stomatohabitans albus]|uniref:succinate dehydrogenase cytochrome b subunit n=1 Tax=Stomatohabitans albus TaxID=3110766 RepID=UPI00300C64EC
MTATRQNDAPARLRAKPAYPSWLAKVVMAVSGALLAAFVTVHMIGNLKVYLPDGEEHLNEYAIFLRTILEPAFNYEGFLWIFRIVMLTALIAHIISAVIVARRGRETRGKHRRKLSGFKNFLARHMLVTGIVLFLFIVFHILDLTAGIPPFAPEGYQHIEVVDGVRHAAAYDNVIASFSRPLVALFYMLAMVVLSMHILHGLGTVAVDLGASNKKIRAFFVWLGWILAAAILIGNTSIPFFVMTGVLK